MAALLALAIGALVWLSLMTTQDHPTVTETESIAAPEIVQPEWRMDVSVEGRQGKLTKADRDAFNRARPAVATLIEDVYDGIFLEPGTLDDVVAQTFTKAAAASLPKELGFPDGASNVEILRRRAHVGVQAHGARNAAAELIVVATAELDEKKVKLRHDATLWLQKESGDWKVIGYDVAQRPLK